MSFGKYIALKSQDDDSVAGIPVFPSRVFRQSSLFVLPDSEITEASDLRGKRIGIPEWAQTASIYAWVARPQHWCITTGNRMGAGRG